MSEPVLLNVGDNVFVTFVWDDLPVGVQVQNVSHAVPSPLAKGAESTSAGSGTSSVKVSSGTAKHGERYAVEATATLSNGEVVVRQASVLVWDQ